MKQIGLVLVSLILLFSMTAVSYAEGYQRGGRGGGDMQLLNQGIACLTGEGAEQNYEKALEIFQQAYEANNKKAARYLGMIYEQGLGVEQDYVKAAEYYSIGIENGDLTSSYYLGLLYEKGLGIEQNYEKAAELFASIAGSDNKSATGY